MAYILLFNLVLYLNLTRQMIISLVRPMSCFSLNNFDLYLKWCVYKYLFFVYFLFICVIINCSILFYSVCQVLELGIVVHSVIIGISLGTAQSIDTIKPLLVALSFHQFFEGMGLGGCISQVFYLE
jgi:hypothetical protein